MKTEIDITEILKDKPIGTKLYADAFGELSLERIKDDEDDGIYVKSKTFSSLSFYSNGKYTKDGEPILVPSKKMTDWNKFAWKKGDVLVSNDGKTNVIFNKWEDDTYVSFYGRHYLNTEDEDKDVYYKIFVCTTEMYSIANKDIAKDYINSIEEKFGGKLNLKTLEIDNPQLKFKDGDVMFVRCKRYCFIEIFNYFKNDDLYDHASLNTTLQMIDIGGEYPIIKDEIVEIRPATDEEKIKLFDALTIKGKYWNAEKKVVEDIKTEYQFKPFDKVLVRDSYNDMWRANLFSHIREDGRYVTTGLVWNFCIPYIGNESLLGTTKDVEE